MKYHRAVREFIKTKLNGISATDLETFAQAYAKDRTQPLNAPTKKRLKAEFEKVMADVHRSTGSTLAVPELGRGSFKRDGRVSSRRPAKLSPCR